MKILPVKVLQQCSGYSSDVANGIKWAANNGARVINLSLGGPGPDSALDAAVDLRPQQGRGRRRRGRQQPRRSARRQATTTTPTRVRRPASIGVGAVDSNFNHACFSNTGELRRPRRPRASAILSTYPPG